MTSRNGFFAVVDDAVAAMVDPLKAITRAFVVAQAIVPPTAEEIDAVYAAFERGQPFAESASLGAIISAGWKLLRARGDLASDDQRDDFKVLCDLIWKTIEVTEYLEKGQGSDA